MIRPITTYHVQIPETFRSVWTTRIINIYISSISLVGYSPNKLGISFSGKMIRVWTTGTTMMFQLQDSPKKMIYLFQKYLGKLWQNDPSLYIAFCQFGWSWWCLIIIWAGLPKNDTLNQQAVIDPESGNDSIIYIDPVLSKKNLCHNLDCRKSCSTCAWMKTPWKRGRTERWRRCSRLPTRTLRILQAPALKAGF